MNLIVKAFVGPWSPDCQAILPGLNSLVASHRGVEFEIINCYTETDHARQYEITTVPTAVFEKSNGAMVARLEGVQPITLYEELIEKWK